MKMDQETFKNNLKTAKELILDEQKLVTYVSLSKELCIHVNEAKSLLNHLVQDIRQNEPKSDVYVCYLISGLLNNNSACTNVCCETDLEAFKKTLKIIFFEHVYCVSRGVQSVDNVALTAVNKFEDFTLCTGLIKANSCIKRSDNEIGNLKANKNVVSIDYNQSSTTKTKATETSKDLMKNGHENNKNTIPKSEPISKAKTPSPKKDIANNSKTIVDKKKPATKGIAGFFNKTNGDVNKTKNVTVKEKPVEVKKEKEEQADVKKHQGIKKEITVKVEPKSDEDSLVTVKTESTNNKSKGKATKNSLKEIKKNAKVDKKRKRVLHVSDSESDTETNDPFAEEENKMAVDQDSEDEIPPTPSANTVKITSGIVNPKKRRKIVDKTYTDEDGYILTKKEEIYESCSDNEEESKINVKQEKENIAQVTQAKTDTSPKENGKAKRKKVSPPLKGKQQTLTSFFKKM